MRIKETTIRLKGVEELAVAETLPEIPELPKRYLGLTGLDRNKAKGKFFRIEIEHESRPTSGAGIAYSNALRIDRREGDAWATVYCSAMRQWRGAYAHEIDDYDLKLESPAILTESVDEVIYAFETGAGNMEVYRFRGAAPEHTFSARGYRRAQERIKLLEHIVEDAGAFCSYIYEQRETRWYVPYELGRSDSDCRLADGDVVLLLGKHADRDSDAITDAYQIHVWVKGCGIGSTKVFRTGLYHPGGRFYYVGIACSATVMCRGDNFFRIHVAVRNRSQQWSQHHELRVEWDAPASPESFRSNVWPAMEKIVSLYRHNHPLYLPTRIAESVVDEERRIATWILFEQIDSDRSVEDSEGWLGDQFRWSVWVMRGSENPERVYEDHAYIRPRTVSKLTGTRGRDCALKNLRLDGTVVRVDDTEGKQLTFGE